MADLIRLNSGKPGPLAERLRAFLSERLIGQERAVKDLVAAAEFFESGFRDAQTPIYVGLLAGPSGVGKTLMAEALAEFFFEDPQAFTKVDCSNYQHESDISSLLGAPPGYIGFYDSRNSEDLNFRGTPPLLDQWNIDKHDFYYRQKKAGKLSAQEKEKKIQALTRRKQSLLNILLSIVKKTAQRVADLQNQAFEMEKEIQDNRLKVAAVELAEALIFLCKARGAKKEKKPTKPGDSEEQKRLAQDILADARMRAQDLLLEHAELMEKSEPVIAKIVEEILKIEEEIQQLNQQNRMGYSPDDDYFSIVLFDEIEKAHPSLHNLLLEVFDKGRLVLRNGSVTRFNHSIILLTSNVGSSIIERILVQGGIGFKSSVKEEKGGTAPGEAIYQAVMREIKKLFSSPFLGRMDNVIVFNPLDLKDYESIFDLQLQKVNDSLVKDWKFAIVVKVNQAVKEFIIKESLRNPEQGARMIKKKIRKYIMTPIVQMKNNREVLEGDIINVELEATDGEPQVILRRLPREGEEGYSPRMN